MDFSVQFAKQIVGIDESSLTDNDREQVLKLLFDYVGCTWGAVDLPWVTAIKKWAKRYAGSGSSAVIGDGTNVSPAVAALVNGTAAHGYELDDTHDGTLSHPGSVVISAALSVVCETGGSGEHFLSAIASGYETMVRLGRAADTMRVIAFGYHPTALYGGFGAASAVANLRGFSVDQLLQSWGHVLSLASGSMQFSDEPVGSTVKRVHAGYAAHAGVLSTELVEAGIDAPRRPIDGKYGFLSLYGKQPNPQLLIEARPSLAINEISLKPYACCRQFHSVIDALRVVTKEFTLDKDNIRWITVRGPKVLLEQHMLRRPYSTMAAQYSLPYVIAATLEMGPDSLDAFTDKYFTDPRFLHWADLVQVEESKSLQEQYPEHFGAEVSVEWNDGKGSTERVLDGLGTREHPFGWEDIRGKCGVLLERVIDVPDLSKIEAVVKGVSAMKDISHLDALLLTNGRSAG